MLRNLLLTTLLSIRAHKLRVFLTMIGIIIGIASVVAISTLGEGMKQQIVQATNQSLKANELKITYKAEEQEETDIPYPVESSFQFSRLDMKKVRDIKGVKEVSPLYNNGMGNGIIEGTLDYFGTQATLSLAANPGENEVIKGRDFRATDSEQDVIIVRQDVFEQQLNKKVAAEDVLGRAIAINGRMFRVIGILPKFDYNNASISTDWGLAQSSFVPKKAFNELAQTKPITTLVFTLTDTADRQYVLKQAQQILKEAHSEAKGSFGENDQEKKSLEEIQKSIGAMTMFLMAITAISLLVGGIGVMNIMYVSVTERKREIGIRRAIGAKPRMILWQFLLESGFITLLGGLIGVCIGYGLSKLLGQYIEIQPIMTLRIFVLSTSVSTFTGLLFGIIPAISAARMDPIKAIYQ